MNNTVTGFRDKLTGKQGIDIDEVLPLGLYDQAKRTLYILSNVEAVELPKHHIVVERLLSLARDEVNDAYGGIYGGGNGTEVRGIYLALSSLNRLELWDEAKKLVKERFGNDSAIVLGEHGLFPSAEKHHRNRR